jgi:hypothetical protein
VSVALKRLEAAINIKAAHIEANVAAMRDDPLLDEERALPDLDTQEVALHDLLNARDCVLDGRQIDARELHGYWVLRALGLTPKESRAMVLYHTLAGASYRPRDEIAAELDMDERTLVRYVARIEQRVPEIRFPRRRW